MKGTRGRQRERRESTQRLGRSQGDTIENNDNGGRGGSDGERKQEGDVLIHALIHIT